MKLTRVLIATTIIVFVSSQMEIEIDVPMSSAKTQGRNPFGIINKMIENIEEQESKLNKKDKHRTSGIEIIEVSPASIRKPHIQFPPFLNSPFFNPNSRQNLILGPVRGFETNPFTNKRPSKLSSPQIIEIEEIIPQNSDSRKKNLRSTFVPQTLNKQANKSIKNEINNDVEQIFNDFFHDIEVSHKKLKKNTKNAQPAKRAEVHLDKKLTPSSNSKKEIENVQSIPAKIVPVKPKPTADSKKQPTVQPKESSKEAKAVEPSKFTLEKIKESFSSTFQGFSFQKHKKTIYIGCFTILAVSFIFFILYFVLSRKESKSKAEMKFMNDCIKLK